MILNCLFLGICSPNRGSTLVVLSQKVHAIILKRGILMLWVLKNSEWKVIHFVSLYVGMLF